MKAQKHTLPWPFIYKMPSPRQPKSSSLINVATAKNSLLKKENNKPRWQPGMDKKNRGGDKGGKPRFGCIRIDVIPGSHETASPLKTHDEP